jgi:hypothetical protein
MIGVLIVPTGVLNLHDLGKALVKERSKTHTLAVAATTTTTTTYANNTFLMSCTPKSTPFQRVYNTNVINPNALCRRRNVIMDCCYFRNVKVKIYKTIILPVVLYGCETWSLTLREEHRLRVFQNRILRRIFGPKGY